MGQIDGDKIIRLRFLINEASRLAYYAGSVSEANVDEEVKSFIHGARIDADEAVLEFIDELVGRPAFSTVRTETYRDDVLVGSEVRHERNS